MGFFQNTPDVLQVGYSGKVVSRTLIPALFEPRRSAAFLAVFAALLCCRCCRAQARPDLEQIVAELREHSYADALKDAKAALGEHPNDPRILTLEGLAAKELNDRPAALNAFETALHIAPSYLPALEGAAELSYLTDPVKARRYLDQLLLQRPAEPTANSMAAMLSYRSGEWAAAASYFAKGGEAVFGQQLTLAAYADNLARLDRLTEAESLFRRLIEQWPGDEQARYNLAVLELRRKETAGAIQTLKPLIDAHNAQALSLAAAAYEAAGDTPRAVAALREAIQQNPKDPQASLDFAAISFDHNSFAAGIAMLNAGLTQLPRSAPLYVARGILLMQSSEVDRAGQDFETANRLDPSQTFGLEAQGLTDLQRHDLPGALAKVRESLRSNPRSAYLNYLAAQILKEQGASPGSSAGEAALAYATRSLELDPALIAARNLLSALLFESGNLSSAEQQCRAALKQDPSDQEALYRLILILRRSGDQEHEIAALVSSLKQRRTEEHTSQIRLDRYRLIEQPPSGAVSPQKP